MGFVGLSATKKPNKKKYHQVTIYQQVLHKGMCCAINKRAINLLNNLTPFYLPIDIVIENEWKFNIITLGLYPYQLKMPLSI